MPLSKCATLDNTTDIYRDLPIQHDSPEHILQAGSGGQFKVMGLIDHATNTQFGHTIDKALTESFRLFRSTVGLASRPADPDDRFVR